MLSVMESSFAIILLLHTLSIYVAIQFESHMPLSGEAGLRTLVMLCMEDKADGGLGAKPPGKLRTTTPYRCLEKGGGNALFSILNHIDIVRISINSVNDFNI